MGLTIYQPITNEDCERIFEKFEDIMIIERAAEMLGMSVAKLRKLMGTNKVPSFKFGKKTIFYKNHLIAYFLDEANSKINEINSKIKCS